MDKLQCKDCGHFLQHYALGNGRLWKVYCGHCTCLQARQKRPDAKACGHFIPGEPPENNFVSREYLSKALLQKVLGMQLLPEIEYLEQTKLSTAKKLTNDG